MQTLLSRVTESSPWLNRALDAQAGKLHAASTPIFGPDGPATLKDALYGTWLGHALHPAVVAVPIGAWATTATFDLLGQHRAADTTLKLGVAGAVGSALTGVAQWYDLQNQDEPRRLGTLHASLNSVALGLYGASWALRSRGRRDAGVATAMTGLALTMTSAWIGGHLSYDLGIGVNRNAFEPPVADWTDLVAFDDLVDGQPTRVEREGGPVVVLRADSVVHAASAVCTHLGGPLDEGNVTDGTCVDCPWHGSVFDLRDGRVVHGPATGPLHAFETQVVNGSVQIRSRTA